MSVVGVLVGVLLPATAQAQPLAEPKPPAGGVLRTSLADSAWQALVEKSKPKVVQLPRADVTASKRGLGPGTSAAPADCAAVRQQFGKAVTSGPEHIACVERAGASKESRAALSKARTGTPGAFAAAATGRWEVSPDSTVIPAWCPLTSGTSYLARMRECHSDTFLYWVYNRQTGVPLGSAMLPYIEWQVMSNKRRTWTHEFRMNVGRVDGLAVGAFLNASGWCGPNCEIANPEPTNYYLLETGKWFAGSFPMGRSGGADQSMQWGRADTELSFLNPVVEVENTWTEVNYINRCDSTLTSTPREGGCTFNDIVPELALDKTDARYGLHAQFVEDAQASTPDHYGSRALGGDPLQRLTDEERTDDNRAESCRGFVKQFADDSCDEYPYAATYQGAAEIGRARTAVGHVPETHNERGGSVLSRFLLANRVIDGDKYWVTPVDGPGGGGPERDTPPTVNAGADVSTSEGSLVQLTGSVDDAQDDSPSVRWSFTPVGSVDPGTTCTFSDPNLANSTFTCNDDGVFVVTLTGDDGVNAPVSDSLTATVRNVAPRLPRDGNRRAAAAAAALGPASWSLYRAGTAVPLTIGFTDPGGNDTQTCSVDWDEGKPAERYPATDSNCNRSHVFTGAGMYTIKATVTDDDGDSEQWSTMVVVYDPAAGTVAGNGWLAAPGDGGFDFAGSYPTGTARIPDGAVTFALPVSADLNLRTHQQLEWLVVTKDGKIAIKGTAERLDGRKVGFVLYAYDGCPAGQTQGCQPGADRLRVVVWDVDRHGPIPEGVPAIYDNRGSSPFDVDVANPQQINAGVIHIQRPAS